MPGVRRNIIRRVRYSLVIPSSKWLKKTVVFFLNGSASFIGYNTAVCPVLKLAPSKHI